MIEVIEHGKHPYKVVRCNNKNCGCRYKIGFQDCISKKVTDVYKRFIVTSECPECGNEMFLEWDKLDDYIDPIIETETSKTIKTHKINLDNIYRDMLLHGVYVFKEHPEKCIDYIVPRCLLIKYDRILDRFILILEDQDCREMEQLYEEDYGTKWSLNKTALMYNSGWMSEYDLGWLPEEGKNND